MVFAGTVTEFVLCSMYAYILAEEYTRNLNKSAQLLQIQYH